MVYFKNFEEKMYQILKAIECSNCHQIMSEPVILPCSHSICKEHVDKTNPTIRCIKCNETHSLPRSGMFPRSEALENIISINLTESSMVRLYNKMSVSCKQLENLVANVKCMRPSDLVNTRLEQIKDHLKNMGFTIKHNFTPTVNHNPNEAKTLRIQKTILETKNFTNIVDGDIKFIYDYIEKYKSQLADHKAISPEYEVEYLKLTKNLKRAETQLLVWDENLQKFDIYEIKLIFSNI